MLAAYVLQEGTRIATRLTAEVWGVAVRAPGVHGAPLMPTDWSLDALLQGELARCEHEVVQLIDDGGRQTQGGLGGGPAMHHPRCVCVCVC